MNPEIKIGAYLCKGCGLGERLDTERLSTVATESGAAVVKQHDYLCSAAGVSLMRDDIANAGVTHLMIGACSRRAKTEAFNFSADFAHDAEGTAYGVATVRTNLREGVLWTQPHSDEPNELTQEMADDYVRMGCAEAKFMQHPQANLLSHNKAEGDHRITKRILVVGGGISGMTAALETARAGYPVLLVEKRGELGGWSKSFYQHLPSKAPYTQPQPNDIDELINQVESESRITVFLHASLARTSGAPGRFSVDIVQAGGSGTVTENVGAIVQASGFKRYDAALLPEFAYSHTADVVDQIGLEELAMQAESESDNAAASTPIHRPSDGKAIESVVFVQCAGQRSQKPGHLPYCSGYCCNVSIKQAMYFKDRNPDIDTNVIYTDLRTPGRTEDFYRTAQEKGIVFTNGVVSRVADASGQLSVCFYDNILGEEVVIQTDLVVLATGQVPNSGVLSATVDHNDIAENPDEKESSDKNTQATNTNLSTARADEPHADMPRGQVKVSVESILNLEYRQGPDLPHLKHGFSDSHFICFPYETRRTGIYACGPVRRPMDISQSIEDATGAALKAIQSAENASRGRAAHPRVGDLSYPSFRRDGCTQCKRCTVECPFGAIDEDQDGYPQFNESRCRRCGTCMGACPVRVISFENYSVDTVGQQIKAIDMPDEFDEKPRILVLACENDAYPALDMAAHNRIEYSAFVRVVPIRCLGSVNLIWVTDALSSGFDGIMLMGCKKGEDYQCHFVTGSELAHERMSKISDTLSQLQLDPERVCTVEVEITDLARIPKLINEYAAKIEQIGMNPFKGF